MPPLYIDLLGYIASFIILISLTMKSIVKLRWINAAGSALFVVFAFLTGSTPTIVMNFGIIAIDLWYVTRLTHNRKDYQLIKAERGSAYLDFFYRMHRAEIDDIFGEHVFLEAKGFSYFVCDSEIAGLFAWKENTPTECQILIDFVTPRFRDSRIGRYFFEQQLPLFREKGYTLFIYNNVGPKHWKYLEAIGFIHGAMGCFTKEI
jgi:GNAT superfamily N-acetyltransferase